MTRVKEENELVTPGDVVFEGEDIHPHSGVYEEDSKIISEFMGTVEYSGSSVRVVPMSGRYIPSEGDIVIGEVSSVSFSNWRVDIDSPYEAMMKIDVAVDEYIDLDEDDLSDYFDVGDAIVTEVTNVTEGFDVNTGMEDRRCRKLTGGRIVKIAPSKVPRVIGRKGTMVRQIKEKTDTTIIVGQNGLVWIKGEDENLATKAVKKVEREAHIDGLTDKMAEWLEKESEQ
ncbi:exosome complex RNA-binding protein Rrp4 [Candidatus Nanohalococcus occultus]|uniref:exosome complex RNA-binding protein Rrp4 n=1 Tax=Candidatus Nanohalococcus occultus TaxID=2978047 RepID=UPI0039E1B404